MAVKAGTQTIQQQEQQRASEASSSGVGCCMVKNLLEFEKNAKGLESFQSFCHTPEFVHFCNTWGFVGTSFSANPYLELPGEAAAAANQSKTVGEVVSNGLSVLVGGATGKKLLCEPFLKACKSLSGVGRKCAIVFHGTPERNVNAILQNGLDPKLRKGQAYGPGEYFGRDPGVSLYYCHGGHKIIVFLCILPDAASILPGTPHDYVVIPEGAHQLPLGFMTFTQTDQEAINRSYQLKQALQALERALEVAQAKQAEAALKCDIIQKLIAGKVEAASEKYQRTHKGLTRLSKQEISMYAHRAMDPEIVSYCFPDLPRKMEASERDDAPIERMDDLETKVLKAQQELTEAKDSFFSPKTVA